jgi:hypothetical protein
LNAGPAVFFGEAMPTIPKAFQRLRKLVRERRGLTVLYGKAANPGTFTVEIFHEEMPMPVCVVWFRFFGLEGIEIDNSFTFEYLRRCGLRTMAHNFLVRAYPEHYFLSGAGTKSGAAWMKAVGYRQTSAGWEFRPKSSK